VARGWEIVLELPGQAHAVVVVRATGPAGIRATDHRFPQAGHALGKTIEGGAEADGIHERLRRARAPYPSAGSMTERASPACLQRVGLRWLDGRMRLA